jgi:hypothetical protein
MTKDIEQLNRRLAEGLGMIGGQPRFAWRFSPEVFYYYRPPTALNFERQCWAEQLGKAWMLCQYQEPKWTDHDGQQHRITPEGWFNACLGEFPYPANGHYVAHPETARMDGSPPTAEATAFYIATIREQMEKDHAAHLAESMERQAAIKLETEKEFMAMADDSFPAFWKNGQGHEAGKRGAHVSFGGV